MRILPIFISFSLLFGFAFPAKAQFQLSGELKKWHRVTITFDGPAATEKGTPNPFTDYRLDVEFRRGQRVIRVPGYFAADGDAANSSATDGNKWRVHFSPDATGTWTFKASFRQGGMVAISDDPLAGQALAFDGVSGQFEISASNKTGKDLRAQGRLEYVQGHFLRFAQSGKYYIKAGSNSPENLLAYEDFDDTPDARGYLKSWGPHIVDWRQGDPTWKNGKGKGIIGAINYLADQGQNSFAMLSLTADGDDGNVFPFIGKRDSWRTRYDCSKLDQWEILFDHADRMGMHFTLTLQENENNHLLDNGALGPERKIYFRELIARFGHHLAMTWNIGEESTNTGQQQMDFARFFQTHDPYRHPLILHTYVYKAEDVYGWLLENKAPYTGASLQATYSNMYRETKEWVERSNTAGIPWTVYSDEPGPPQYGVPDDGFTGTPSQDDIRSNVLWGNLMAGGGGVDYYFGYKLRDNDLTCQDFRSREKMWAFNRHALGFFHAYLPFHEMKSRNDLIGNPNDNNGLFCLAKPGEVYAIYVSNGSNIVNLDVGNNASPFEISWYDPRVGGALQTGSVANIKKGANIVSLGAPPSAPGKDWVILVRNGEGPQCPVAGSPCDDGDPGTENDVENGNCNCSGTPVPNPEPGSGQHFWLEAECASAAGSTWKLVDDDDASGAKALRIPPNTTNLDAPSSQNRHLLQFQFNVSERNTFAAFVRLISKGPNHDSFWVRFDDGPWGLWQPSHSGNYSDEYQWARIQALDIQSQQPLNRVLGPGKHSITFSIRESTMWLDKLFISSGTQVPTGFGELDEQCGSNCLPEGTPCNDGDPSTENDKEDGQCICAGTPIETEPPGGGPGVEWFEAECAEDIGFSWKIADHSDASNGRALNIPKKTTNIDSPSGERRRRVNFSFSADQAGTYRFFARTITPGPDHDSFWFRIDDGEWALWDNVNNQAYSPEYQWDRVEGMVGGTQRNAFVLGKGEHTLTLSIREGNIWLDKVFISAGGTTPTGMGGFASCPLSAYQTLPESLFGFREYTMAPQEQIRLYPNPVQDVLHVEYILPDRNKESDPHQLTIVDVYGRTVHVEQVSGSEQRIERQMDLSHLPAGTYIFFINNEDRLLKKLFIKPE